MFTSHPNAWMCHAVRRTFSCLVYGFLISIWWAVSPLSAQISSYQRCHLFPDWHLHVSTEPESSHTIRVSKNRSVPAGPCIMQFHYSCAAHTAPSVAHPRTHTSTTITTRTATQMSTTATAQYPQYPLLPRCTSVSPQRERSPSTSNTNSQVARQPPSSGIPIKKLRSDSSDAARIALPSTSATP